MLKYRPWGELEWVIGKLSQKKWDLLGCISFEDRAISTLDVLQDASLLRRNHFLKIIDPESEYKDDLDKRMESVEKEYNSLIRKVNRNLSTLDLLCFNNEIVQFFNQFIEESKGNIILDVSCFPKRFFFPFIKLALSSSLVKNFIITYSTPKSYTKKELSEDPEPWDHIPLFGPTKFPEPTPKHAIVGVGFLPFGLSKLLKDKYSSIPVSFFFPFPPGAPYFQRSWEFLRNIESSYRIKQEDLIRRINSLDISDVFNHIKSITNEGIEPAIFAPYGPKPMSVAIALYASIFDCPAYYTQPKKYNPFYSSGRSNVYSYIVKQNNKILFS